MDFTTSLILAIYLLFVTFDSHYLEIYFVGLKNISEISFLNSQNFYAHDRIFFTDLDSEYVFILQFFLDKINLPIRDT